MVEAGTSDDLLPQAATLSSSTSEDSEQMQATNSEQRDSDLLRPSLVPKWLKDLEEKQDEILTNRSILSASVSRDSMVAPDWLREFEEQQSKLLDALKREASIRTSILGGGATSATSAAATSDIPPPSDPPAPPPATANDPPPRRSSRARTEQPTAVAVATLDDTWEGQSEPLYQPPPAATASTRQSIAPDWLIGFEAEQKKLLEAMQNPQDGTATQDVMQDSLAMLQDTSLDAPEIYLGDSDEEDVVLPKIAVQEEPEAVAAPPPAPPEEEEIPAASAAPVEEEDDDKKPSPPTSKPSTARRETTRASMAVPDWLLEFESQQEKLLQVLERGDSSLNLMATTSTKNDLAASTTRARPSITPEWLQDFEAQQKQLLEELHFLSASTTVNVEDTDGKPITSVVVDEDHKSNGTKEQPTQTEQPKQEMESVPPKATKTNELSSAPAAQKKKLPPPIQTTISETAPGIAIKSEAKPATTTSSSSSKPTVAEFQKVKLRKISPTAAQRQIAEDKLSFAEKCAKAITPKGGDNANNNTTTNWEALRHVDHLKQHVADLQQQEQQEEQGLLQQINKLQQELLDVFDNDTDQDNDLFQNWLLPMQSYGDSPRGGTSQADANADQLALFKAQEWGMVTGLQIVKKVLEFNFKAIHGTSCLDTIHDYAMLKLGKKKRRRADNAWEHLLNKLFEEAANEDGDVHLRVRNALVLWVVREILFTSKDEISSRMCFHATYLIASLKVELERVAPAALQRFSKPVRKGKMIGIQQNHNSPRRISSGRHHDAPAIVKKLLNRENSGSSDSPQSPLDLPPEDEAMSGSDKVDFVRETIAKTEEDTMEDNARITSRKSTFVKIGEGKDMDESAVSDAVNSYKPPTKRELMLQELANNVRRKSSTHTYEKKGSDESLDSSKRRTRGAHERVPTAFVQAAQEGKKRSEASSAATTAQPTAVAPMDASQASAEGNSNKEIVKEDESNLPLPVQDAHRVIRTILGPSHPNITVSLCFEALRVYAALIDAWKNAGTEKSRPPSEEELKIKSLERSVFDRSSMMDASRIDQQLEEERHQEMQRQEEAERRARLEIARKREEKKTKREQKAKKGKPMQDHSEVSHSPDKASRQPANSKTSTGAKSDTQSPAKARASPTKSNASKQSDSHVSLQSEPSTKARHATVAAPEEGHRRKSMFGKLVKSARKSFRKKTPKP